MANVATATVRDLIEIAGTLLDDRAAQRGEGRGPVTGVQLADAVRQRYGDRAADPGRISRALVYARARRGRGDLEAVLRTAPSTLTGAERAEYERLIAEDRGGAQAPPPPAPEPEDLTQELHDTVDQVGALVRRLYQQGRRDVRSQERSTAEARLRDVTTEAQGEVARVQRLNDDLQAVEADLTERLLGAQQRAEELNRAVAALTRQGEERQRDLAARERELAASQQSHADVLKALDAAQRLREQTANDLTRITQEFATTKGELAAATTRIAVLEAAHAKAIADQKAAFDAVLSERMERLKDAQTERQQLHARIRELEDRLLPKTSGSRGAEQDASDGTTSKVRR